MDTQILPIVIQNSIKNMENESYDMFDEQIVNLFKNKIILVMMQKVFFRQRGIPIFDYNGKIKI